MSDGMTGSPRADDGDRRSTQSSWEQQELARRREETAGSTDPTPASLAQAREIALAIARQEDADVNVWTRWIALAIDAVAAERDAEAERRETILRTEYRALEAVIAARNQELARSLEIQAGVLAEMDQMRTAIKAKGTALVAAGPYVEFGPQGITGEA